MVQLWIQLKGFQIHRQMVPSLVAQQYRMEFQFTTKWMVHFLLHILMNAYNVDHNFLHQVFDKMNVLVVDDKGVLEQLRISLLKWNIYWAYVIDSSDFMYGLGIWSTSILAGFLRGCSGYYCSGNFGCGYYTGCSGS